MQSKNVKRRNDADEARRRARILDRYVNIELPTAHDDETTATELGLSVGHMIRLSEVWRRHRDELLLVGQTTALNRGGGAQRQEVLSEAIDLEKVRPERRDEVLRRIRIIQRHILAVEQGRGDAAEAAREVGVSPQRFDVLLQKWKLKAQAEALPGATRRRTPWRREPDRKRRLRLLGSMLASAAGRVTLRSIYDDFTSACIREGLKPLSVPRFYAIVQTLDVDNL